MITAQKVMRELSTGISAVCAWCDHYHNAVDRAEARGIEVVCGMDCGGPSVSRGFPAYKGIMEGQLATFCFICGRDADAGVEIGGRMLGVCNNMGPGNETCMDKLRRLLARQRVIAKENVVVVVNGGKKELADK